MVSFQREKIQIVFNLPEHGVTTIIIYDFEGRKIMTLYNSLMIEGEHSIDWDTKNLPSGIYFCKIDCGSFSKTMKIVVEH